MAATVAQFPADMGRQGIESAVRVLKGERISEESTVKIQLVTKENANAAAK